MNRLFFAILLLGLISCKGNEKTNVPPTVVNGELNWLTISEADQILGPSSKKYLVDVYTDWCGWCKVMDKKTFTDPTIIEYLEKNFHVVKFDAEAKESIDFGGKTYKWTPRGRNGVNELAVELLGGRLSYPSIVFLDENKQKITVSIGYKDPQKLMNALKSI